MVVATWACAVAPQFSEIHGFRRGAFLARGMGARPVGMGEAFTAVADDVSAVAWNPAGLGQVPRLQAVAMYDAADNGLGLSFGAIALPLGTGVVAVSIAALNYGAYELRDNQGFLQGEKSAMDLAGSLSYALTVGGGWFGVGVEGVSEAVGGTLVAGNAGVLLSAGPKLSLGFAVQHMGMKDDRGFSLPAIAKGGAAYLLTSKLRLALDLGYGLTEKDYWVAADGELSPSSFLALRAGYKRLGVDQGLMGLTGLSAGAGFRFGKVGIDYAYQPFGDLASSHRIALLYGLGPAEQVARVADFKKRLKVGISTLDAQPKGGEPSPVAKQSPGVQPGAQRDYMFRLGTKVTADKAYAEAVRLYSAGDYDGAWRQAAAVLQADPDHWKAWQMMGNCQYAKGDKAGALVSYRESLRIQPDNPRLKAWVDQISK